MKKRGGQAGNKNALKHGYYSELFSTLDIRRAKTGNNIEDEQALLRSKAFRLAKRIHFDGELDETELKAMNTLSLIIQQINTIERTKLLAKGHGGDIATTILEAIQALDPWTDLGI